MSTPDCGPHCSQDKARGTHCGCAQCHGKPVKKVANSEAELLRIQAEKTGIRPPSR